jgi:hypothetical protein
MTAVETIFAAFGGVTPLAKRLNVPVTTAHAWKRSGNIPRWRMADITRVASEDGISLPEDATPTEDRAA